jgi:enterochelin esterase family protein
MSNSHPLNARTEVRAGEIARTEVRAGEIARTEVRAGEIARTEVRAYVLLLLMSLAPAVAAQAPAPPPQVTSPEVHDDRRVTLRIYAPKATEVTLRGDWMEGPGTTALTKGDNGVWAATVGPLPADFYSYSLYVDGVRTLDPRNASIKQGVTSVENMMFVPGPDAAYQSLTAVPHGEIRQVWYPSSTLGGERRMHVYTPPGYDGGTTRYPVFYLLHGGGDDDSGWSTIGRAGFILDNLIAAGKAKPMLVVMPNGSLPRPANLPPTTPGQPPSPEVIAAMASLQDRFVSELMNDVIPAVEKRFRVLTDPANRAIAGLSMGGGQTQRVIGTHPDKFAYVGVWSAGVNPATLPDFETRNAAFLKAAPKVNGSVKVYNVTVGDKDFALPGSKALVGVLEKHGIKHTLTITGGGHTWLNWRPYLRDFAQQLFK